MVESADCKLKLKAQTVAEQGHEIALSFQPAEARFVGDARAELVPGPIQIELSFGGKNVSGTLAATALLTGPEFGGTLVSAGDFGAELVAHKSGEVQAFVQTAAGARVKGDAAAKFKVSCQGKAGGKHDIDLAFDAPSASFKGRAAAGAELNPGPIEFAADVNGKAQLGRLEKLCLFGAASHGGKLIAAGDFGVELVAGAGGEVKAYVTDLTGQAHVSGDLDLKLFAGADAKQAISFSWDAPSLCYKAKLKAKLDLAVEPVQLAVALGGKVAIGALNSAKLAAGARLSARANLAAQISAKADAKLGAAANAKLDVAAPNLKAKINEQAKAGVKAAVNVPAPKVNVAVNKSASAGAKAGTGAKASAKAGISFGTK